MAGEDLGGRLRRRIDRLMALQPASANAATARMTGNRMAAFQARGDRLPDKRVVDAEESSAIRFP